MVDNKTLIKPHQLAVFALLLLGVGLTAVISARHRMGLIALRSGFAVFNVLSFFYCLSLADQKAWETSGRIAIALRRASKESSDVECN